MNKLTKILLAPISVITLALGVSISLGMDNSRNIAHADAANWVQVTSIDDFVDGGQYLLTHAGSTSYLVPGSYTSSNPASASLNLATIAQNQAWTFDNVGTNQWQIFNGSNYLKIQTNTTSGLRTEAAVPSTHFTIATGTAENTFKFMTSSTGNRAIARYTGGSDWRSYANTDVQSHLTIYKYTEIEGSPLASLSKSGTLAKTSYYAGDYFDPTGLTFTATYEDESTADVTEFVLFDPNPLTGGTTSVLASYTEGGITESVSITGITVIVPSWSVVSYDITSKNTLTTSGTAPSESSATIVETYSTSKQMTANNSQTVTLSNYTNILITKITLSARSNTSSGEGNFSYSLDGGSTFTDIISTAAFNDTSWYGSWSTSYVDVEKTVDIVVSSSIILKVAATVNSLYVQSYDIQWELDPVYLEAKGFADEVMTGAGLDAEGSCETVLSELEALYDSLSVDAKSHFDNSTEALFVNARARLAYLESWVAINAPENPVKQPSESADRSNFAAITIFSIIGLASIIGYCFIYKKKLLG